MGLTLKDLKDRQGWSLTQKIDHSVGAIESFVSHLGLDSVYVSFSGGKDSTVLLDLARMIYPDIRAAFCNTGNEYPDVVRFVKTTENVDWVRPELTPKEIWGKYGFPLVSKEVSQMIYSIRQNPFSRTSTMRLESKSHGLPKKWRFLLAENFNVSHRCCEFLKKKPFHKYEKETGRHPILGTMASESRMRERDYLLQGGCNSISETGRSRSMPLSIWTERDIWDYISERDLPIADIYHKGAKHTGCMGCGFGCHFPDDERFQILYREYPKCYDMVMNYTSNGITFRHACNKVMNVNGIELPK